MATTIQQENSIHHNATGGREYLTFRLGNEDYGVDILKVREIRGFDANITAIVNAPEVIKGVVNLRGVVVPIVDMRVRLDLGALVDKEHAVVIILDLRSQVIGMVVDSVSDVITLQESEIKPTPSMGSTIDTEYVTGIGMVDARMVILVDADRLMSFDDLLAIEGAAA